MVLLLLIGLLLASRISACNAAESSQHHTYSATQYRNVNDGLNVIGADSYSLGTSRRQNRAFSQFQSAWKAIRRTTYGLKRERGPGTDTRKYTKVGSMSDAIEDFYSFNPRGVQNHDGLLLGLVDGLRQTIILDTIAVDTPILILTAGKVGSKKVVSRTITYTPRVH